jgi:molybdopterin-biosynthesis enzyme MoeA-like protein
MARTAAALIIGNELLTGKVKEGNLAFLGKELFVLGIRLRRVVLCEDDAEVIADELTALRTAHDLVFTSGGVGPTPDDVTLPGVARSFERPLVRSPLIEGLIRGHWQERTTEGHLRMAEVPEGAELLHNPEMPWPVVIADNVFVLPGVPEIFRVKFRLLAERLGTDVPFVSLALYTMCDEGEIASTLERLEREHPGVAIGSYPRFRDPEYKTKLTFDAREHRLAQAALEACVDALPTGCVVRSDGG